MKKLAFLIFFSLSSLLSFSQFIEGKVLDAISNKPIEGVHVYLKYTNGGAFSNNSGKYYLKFLSKINNNDTIFFSHIGYKTVKLPYSKNKSEYSVFLIKKINVLENVEILSKKYLKQKLHYKKLASMEKGIHSFGSLLKNDKIYVVGGDASFEVNDYLKYIEEIPDLSFDEMISKAKANYSKESYKGDVLIYDIKLDKWEIEEKKFKKRAYHNLNYYNNKLYVLGGKRIARNRKFEYLENQIEIFDQEKNTITIDNTNPHQAVDFASFLYGDKIIVMGGSIKKKSNGFKEYSNKIHLYNIKSGFWYELGPMPVAKEASGVLIKDKIYLVGGFNKKALMAIETYDLITGKWKKEGDLFKGISNPAITHSDEILYIFEDGKMLTYNLLTKELNVYYINLFLKASKLFYSGNTLYILGGFREKNYSAYPSRGLFSIDLKEFKNTKIHKSKKL